MDAKYSLDGSADHGVSEAVYLRDPDGNGVELYVDRPREKWKVGNDGMVEMVTEPLDLKSILQELNT
jgi:catechol 2,3-dioxygenase